MTITVQVGEQIEDDLIKENRLEDKIKKRKVKDIIKKTSEREMRWGSV